MEIRNDSELYQLTSTEKLKLLRNIVIFSLLDIVVIVFFAYLFMLYHKLDWFSGCCSILILGAVIALFLAIRANWLDYVSGEVIIFSGYVEKKEHEIRTDSPGAYYITIADKEYQIGAKYYNRIKVNDYVIIRKAPRTHYTLGVEIKSGKLG